MTTIQRPAPGAKGNQRVEGHALRPIETGARLFSRDFDLPYRIRATIAGWLDTHPDRGATMEEAAAHESGHFVVAEASGLEAMSAAIYPGAGWSGLACAWHRPLLCSDLRSITADDLEKEAAFALAGPTAERVIGDGDPYGSPGELLEVCILVARAADMRGQDRASALYEIANRTGQLVTAHAEQIQQIAAQLMKKAKSGKPIKRFDPPVMKNLRQTVRTSQIKETKINSTLAGIMHCMLTRAPIDLAIFTAEVGK